jgi:sugar lactone lactonase YvrE
VELWRGTYRGEIVEDPTEGKYVQLSADWILAAIRQTLFLNAPRSLAFASDGTMYVADSRNHRIVHFDVQGNVSMNGAPLQMALTLLLVMAPSTNLGHCSRP